MLKERMRTVTGRHDQQEWRVRGAVTQRSLAHGAIVLGLTLLYAALVFVNSQRRLWFDELLTFDISKTPTLKRLLYLVKTWDLSPPTGHILAHYSMRFFGVNALGVRLPSIVEFYIASLMLLWYVSRKVGYAYGPAALLVLWCSPALYYATEARPYALLCMWFCCLLVSWDAAVTEHGRTLALCAVAISSLGLIESHVFGPISLFPFLAAEAFRWYERRKPDYPLWLALLLPLVALIGYAPLYRTYESIAFYPPAFQGSFKKMASFYWHGARDIIWYALLALLGGFLANGRKIFWRKPEKFRMEDAVLLAVLIANPIFLDIVMMRDHAPFWPRYCITSLFGLYILFSLFLASLFRARPRPGYAAALVLAGMILVLSVAIPMRRTFVVRDDSAALIRMRPDLPLVAASGLTFVEMNHYEPASLVSRLFYLRDRTAAIRYAHATMFEDLDRFSREFGLPGKVVPYRDFIRTHHEFLVLGTFSYPEDWLLKRLAAENARIVFLGRLSLVYKDKDLYIITVRDSSKRGTAAGLLLRKPQTTPAANVNAG